MIARMKPYLINLCLIAVVFAILTATGCAVNRKPFPAPTPSDIFGQAVNIIQNNYIDKSGSPVRLDIGMRPDISALVAQTDETTAYWTPEEVAVSKDSFGGALGILWGLKNGSYEIIKPYPGSPALKAGLHRGDKILEIDGRPTEGLPMPKATRLLQGAPGTAVVLKVADKSGNEKVMKLTREVVPTPKSAAERLIGYNTGYLRIDGFWPGTATEVWAAMKRLSKQDINGLVIDLRNNSGGRLSSIAGAAELFMQRHEVIVELGDKKEEDRIDFRAWDWFPYLGFPLAVLIDGRTASGAEIFAAALRDNEEALLVGEKTAGRCDIQTTYTLTDGSQIRLRTALAYRPSGEPIDGQGVKPDKEVVVSKEEQARIYGRMESFPDLNAVDSAGDPQLRAAVAVLHKNL